MLKIYQPHTIDVHILYAAADCRSVFNAKTDFFILLLGSIQHVSMQNVSANGTRAGALTKAPYMCVFVFLCVCLVLWFDQGC